MSSILEFWTKQIPKKKRKKENNKKNTVMFTSEGRDGLTQVFVLLVLLFFPSLRQRQREAKEAQGKGNWSRAKKKTMRRVTIPMPILATIAIDFLP